MGWGEPHRPLSPERLGVEMANAAYEQVAAERDRLQAAIEHAIYDLDEEHQPEWASDEMKARGKDPLGCAVCFPKDSGWPCFSRDITDDLRAALDPQEASDGD